jgi:hypothetical protein
MPLEIDQERNLVVIGGRAFVSGTEYRETAERFRSGDLQNLDSDEAFRNLIFADEVDLDHAALRISKAAGNFKPAEATDALQTKEDSTPIVVAPETTPEPSSESPVLQQTASEHDKPFAIADSVRRFAEQIDASDPAGYQSIVEDRLIWLTRNAARCSCLMNRKIA